MPSKQPIDWQGLRNLVNNTSHAVVTVAAAVGFIAGAIMNLANAHGLAPTGVAGQLMLVCGPIVMASKFIDSNHSAVTNWAMRAISTAQGALGGGDVTDRIHSLEAAVQGLISRSNTTPPGK